MQTKNLDVVYFVKDASRNEELKYSLRSVSKNLPHHRVWIFGGCPDYIVPDIRVKVDQQGETKWDRVRMMFKIACENKELTSNFVLFNDDFFVMQPTERLLPWYRCSLGEHISLIEAAYRDRPTEYTRKLREADKELGANKETLSYELHVPFIFNKKKLLRILDGYPEQHCSRTLYGNIYKIGGEQHRDIKLFSDRPSFDYRETQFLSTDDSIININNEAWRYIRDTFKEKSEYEK